MENDLIRSFIKYSEGKQSLNLFECRVCIISLIGIDVSTKDLRDRIQYIRCSKELKDKNMLNSDISFDDFLILMDFYDNNVYHHTEFAAFDKLGRGYVTERELFLVLNLIYESTYFI